MNNMIAESAAIPLLEISVYQFNSESLVLIIFVMSFNIFSFWLVVKCFNINTVTWNYLSILGTQLGIRHKRVLISIV